ncbi:zf-DHHC-domain-containing protein [Artomyces pyxidatus]|uniref:Zf-DHHC-domain-containing protein n=1 Tax=Artomyces pyxidatus TaxID=48021 RepID=A0ACB8THS7_9AGAM|nr:zf-DHHC-domain-containing protein [Artomyces pyxidatus]
MGRLLGRIVVGLTLSLISFISYSSQIFIIWPWYGREVSIELLTLLVPFNVLVGLLLWNYWLCVLTDPGGVPNNWRPDTASLEGYEVKKLTGGPRFCRTCNQYKPPRAHHCKDCKRCVLRMDHHCPWVNNCVGYYNHGHFIRFLFFVDVATSYHLIMITRRVFDVMGENYLDVSGSIELVFIILNFVTCIPVWLMVGAFSLYHFYSLLGNTTTIEGWEKDKVATLIRRGKIREVKFPYNLGSRRNIESVLGKNPLMWFCPTVPPGTGLKYQLAEGDNISPQESWPPRDPTAVPNLDHKFELPPSPWTYEDGINPDLQPSSARQRAAAKRRKGVSAVPPYHPDYEDPGLDDHDSLQSSDEYDEYDEERGVTMRRGSEGYEVRPVDREEILRRYIQTRGEEAGRYRRYVPEPPSESESESDDEPLAERVDRWRSGDAIS